MNKKGFTLIEIIGVVIIMGLILVIVFPATVRLIKDNQNTKFEKYYEIVSEGTELYAKKKIDVLGSVNSTGCMEIESIDYLVENDYIKEFEDEDYECSTPSNFDLTELKGDIDTSKNYVDLRVKNDHGKITVEESLICVKGKKISYSKLVEKGSGTCMRYDPATESITCPAGTKLDGEKCVACPKGEYGDGVACYKCLSGTYSNSEGSASCNQCPKGTYSTGEGNIECTQCQVGMYQDKTGQIMCNTCPNGYTSDKKTTAITGCYMDVPNGKYIKVANDAAPTTCDPGTFKTSHRVFYGSKSLCDKCVLGSYSSAGASTCNACTNGKTTTTSGSSSCNANCSNNSNVSTWTLASWQTNNTLLNNCKIASCATGYTLQSNNTCKDVTPPTCGTVSGASTSWTNGNRTISVVCNDNGSGCSQASFSQTFSSTAQTSNITIKDNVGNTTNCPVNVYIDKAAPTCGTVSGASTSWTNGNRTISVVCNDNGSGCSQASFSQTFSSTAQTSNITIKDNVGNTTNCPVNVYIDKVAPVCGTVSGASTSWTGSNRNISVGCSDNLSGCTSNSFSNNWTTSTTTSSLTLKDNAGNTTNCPVNVYVDKTAPTCTTSKSNTKSIDGVTVSITCSDGSGSGCSASNVVSYTKVIKDTTYTVKDNSGNSGSCSVTVTAVDQTRYRTRTWNSCKTGSKNACVGGYVDEAISFDGTSADCYSKHGVISNDGRCMHAVWDDCKSTENTCKGGWNNYDSWSSWSDSKCTPSDSVDCDSRTIYK